MRMLLSFVRFLLFRKLIKNNFHFYRYSNIIDEAIDITLRKRNQSPPENLTAQDVFYVQVTRVHELFKALATIADSSVQQEQSSVKLSQTLLDISKIFLVSTKFPCLLFLVSYLNYIDK